MRSVLFAAAAVCTAACSAAVAAERPVALSDAPPQRVIEDRLSVEIGILPASISTDARVDQTAATPGTPFNAEDDFGLDDSRVLPTPEITFRPGQRHLFRLSSLVIRRDGTAVLERDIVYDEDEFEEGDIVDSTLDLNLIGITYGYELLRKVDYSLAATFGIQVVEVKTNAVERGQGLRQPSGETAPVPALGIEGRYFFYPQWSVEARLQYFKVSQDQLEGTFFDGRIAVTWQVNPHLGVGLGYRSFDLDAESFDDNSSGLVNMTIQAPLIFARASF